MFRGIRDHSHMRFADSYAQDMDFWRQRVSKEQDRAATPSAFNSETLRDLPCNPFKDSAGMLFGSGVSQRRAETPMGVLNPNLASYRAAVTPTTYIANAARPNSWSLGIAPYRVGAGSPQERADRGAQMLQTTRPFSSSYRTEQEYQKVRACPTRARPPRAPPDVECSRLCLRAPRSLRWQHLLIEAPDMRICASRRLGMPRARLDARMYAPSPA